MASVALLATLPQLVLLLSLGADTPPQAPPAVIFGYELPPEVSWPRLVVAVGLIVMVIIHSVLPQRPPGITVAELWVYPIKGCHGVRMNSVKVDRLGFENDRRLMVRSPHCVRVNF